MTDQLSFYQTHSPMTDPGSYAYLYDDLPDNIQALIKIVKVCCPQVHRGSRIPAEP